MLAVADAFGEAFCCRHRRTSIQGKVLMRSGHDWELRMSVSHEPGNPHHFEDDFEFVELWQPCDQPVKLFVKMCLAGRVVEVDMMLGQG